MIVDARRGPAAFRPVRTAARGLPAAEQAARMTVSAVGFGGISIRGAPIFSRRRSRTRRASRCARARRCPPTALAAHHVQPAADGRTGEAVARHGHVRQRGPAVARRLVGLERAPGEHVCSPGLRRP